MKYLCLAYYDAEKYEALSDEQCEALERQCPEHDAALHATGQLFAHGALAAPDMAASIRPEGGAPMMADGPFIKSSQQIGGIFIIEADSLSDALRVAAKHPAARLGEEAGWGIEVRPIEVFEMAE